MLDWYNTRFCGMSYAIADAEALRASQWSRMVTSLLGKYEREKFQPRESAMSLVRSYMINLLNDFELREVKEVSVNDTAVSMMRRDVARWSCYFLDRDREYQQFRRYLKYIDSVMKSGVITKWQVEVRNHKRYIVYVN